MTQSVKERIARRANSMLSLYREGKTLQAIGTKYNLTRERVRQILSKAFGIKGADGGIAEQKRMRHAARIEIANQRCLKKYDCDYATYIDVIWIGKTMMRSGRGREVTPRGAFDRQKQSAISRGIDWQLTFGQWWRLWQQSGKFQERGRKRGQYVMARIGDSGPYAIGNVQIIECSDNARLARIHKPSKYRAVEERGVYLVYPGLKKMYVAKHGRRHIGYFETIEEAQEARRAAIAA